MDDYLSTREAADSLGITYNKLMGWLYKGKIPARRLGRCWYIHRGDVESLLRPRVAA